jgi:predicted nucleic acid-binding protein
VKAVLIDERKARKVARDIPELQVIGSALTLVESRRRGLVVEVASLFQKLRQEGYWIHETIVQAALREAGEGV